MRTVHEITRAPCATSCEKSGAKTAQIHTLRTRSSTLAEKENGDSKLESPLFIYSFLILSFFNVGAQLNRSLLL